MTETTDLQTRLLQSEAALRAAYAWVGGVSLSRGHHHVQLRRREVLDALSEAQSALRDAAASLPPAPNPEDVQADLDAWKVWQGKEPPAPPVSEGTAKQALLRDALEAARDMLAAFQKQAGWLPEQGGYSTRMTPSEMQLAHAVADIDSILAAFPSAASALPRAETPLPQIGRLPWDGCPNCRIENGVWSLCEKHTPQLAADPAGGETTAHYVPEDQRVNCVDSPTDQHGYECVLCGNRLGGETPAPPPDTRAAFYAGWAAAKHDDRAADDEDVADAPDVAFIDWLRGEASSAPAPEKGPYCCGETGHFHNTREEMLACMAAQPEGAVSLEHEEEKDARASQARPADR